MSEIHFKTQDPRYFLTDSKGDLYEVSEEIAKCHSDQKAVAVVSRIEPETNTIWFAPPLLAGMKAEKPKHRR